MALSLFIESLHKMSIMRDDLINRASQRGVLVEFVQNKKRGLLCLKVKLS